MSFLVPYVFLCLLVLVKTVCKTRFNSSNLQLFIEDSSDLSFHPSLNLLSQKADAARPEIIRQDNYFFTVKIRVGTFQNMQPPYKEYLLHIDTGSPITWLPCEECKNCSQQQHNFSPKTAQNHSNPFFLQTSFATPTKATDATAPTTTVPTLPAFLAKKTFSLPKPYPNTVFGCGTDQADMAYGNTIAGALGLGRGPNSFVAQIAQEKFSHCFPSYYPPDKSSDNHLRFGADAVSPKKNKKMMTTKLYQIEGSPFYYVEMVGISLNGHKLAIDPNIFRFNNSGGGGGVIINSGVRFSQLIKPAYKLLEAKLDSYYLKSSRNVVEKVSSPGGRICYRQPRNMRLCVPPPTLTFHFKGVAAATADLVIRQKDALLTFSLTPKWLMYCLGINPGEKVTEIGARLQMNHWFTFDTNNSLLSFHHQSC